MEGTPDGIAMLKKTLKAIKSVFSPYFLTDSGTCYRCPLHIPPLRRGPSPAGEGFWGFRPEVIRIRPGFQIPPVCTAPHQSRLRRAGFPGGEAFERAVPPVRKHTGGTCFYFAFAPMAWEMASRSLSTWTGLEIWPSMPAVRAALRSSSKALAVMARMGMRPRLPGRARMRRVAS